MAHDNTAELHWCSVLTCVPPTQPSLEQSQSPHIIETFASTPKSAVYSTYSNTVL